MALSLGIIAGEKILIGSDPQHVVEVKAVFQSNNLIIITVDGGPDIAISDQSRTEILPGVSVFSGVGRNGSRLAFIAPKEILIYREELDDV